MRDYNHKRKLKEQIRTIDGKFDKKANNNSQQLIDNNSGDALVEEFFDEDEDWGDDDDSKTPKSTYYDKYGPSGSLTKVAAGTKKITNFFNNNLKEQLEKQHNQLTVIEYNYKRVIFEYLTLLNNNNRREKYWLLNNKLPESRYGKHQKMIRVIDDEDVAERCHIWI
ncbi:hypothetical protein RhiirC2_801582 [Rhizophagus irregularis]|uniref:Uncharacterized protein n=1 Tax=Rhizophagus irregularis TaxID=588596 RepID=A0A2N1M288_9GLOM|nr:hypothetical protein RhiirC2_801582 [Rhizophagus irregularis]